jgi:hypothetical protein
VTARAAALSIWLLIAAAGCGGQGAGEQVRTVTVTDTVTATETVTLPAQTPETDEAAESSKQIAHAEAVAAARRSASEYLTMAGLGFGVEPDDWQVSCSPRESGMVWDCRVEQGPCSGELEVRRVTIGGQIRGVGEVGCAGD